MRIWCAFHRVRVCQLSPAWVHLYPSWLAWVALALSLNSWSFVSPSLSYINQTTVYRIFDSHRLWKHLISVLSGKSKQIPFGASLHLRTGSIHFARVHRLQHFSQKKRDAMQQRILGFVFKKHDLMHHLTFLMLGCPCQQSLDDDNFRWRQRRTSTFFSNSYT